MAFPDVQFIRIQPGLGEGRSLYMLEYFGASVILASPHEPDALEVQIWTNAPTKFNSQGDWHSLDLTYERTDASGQTTFVGGFRPTSEGDYEFTYRVKLRGSSQWQWAGWLDNNGRLQVRPPSPTASWTQGPSYVEILPQVYVGNFIAASQAEQLGLDAVLNLGEELTVTYAPDSSITYQKMGTPDGAHHPISEEILRDAVQWIEAQRQQGKQRILVHCRAGIGRSGSVGVAYCFYKHPHWTYEQALLYAWSKKADIYPHRNLQESLERLFPRQTP
ncbi:MAG: dual specificity protein phosphatase family protein [Elainellaceae cyanobacterium]